MSENLKTENPYVVSGVTWKAPAECDSTVKAETSLNANVSTTQVSPQPLVVGACPFCLNNSNYRELSLGENVLSVGKFVGGLFSKSHFGKLKEIIDVVTEKGSYPNYVCLSCNKNVMQCGGCKKIIPYTDTGRCPHCDGMGNSRTLIQNSPVNLVNQTGPAEVISPPPIGAKADDVMAMLEKLGELKVKGILTQEEFDSKKAEFLKKLI